jgi:hypothetical protein
MRHSLPIESRLRTRLEQLTLEDVPRHEQLMDALRIEIPHTIKKVAEDHPLMPHASEQSYRCYEFALNLADSTAYDTLRRGLWARANAEFVQSLINTLVLKSVAPEHASSDRIVVYRNAGEVKHLGRIAGDRVISKWGKGKLWEHALHEVPQAYGDTYEFYETVPMTMAVAAFIERCGTSPDEIPDDYLNDYPDD